jgi:NADPH-dependent curcumin reductase CurA
VDTKFCKTRKDVYATLSHEAVHAIDFIFNAIGSKDRDEVFAHSVAAIVRKYR